MSQPLTSTLANSFNLSFSDVSFDEKELRKMALKSLSKHPALSSAANQVSSKLFATSTFSAISLKTDEEGNNANTTHNDEEEDEICEIGQQKEQELREKALLSITKQPEELCTSNSAPVFTTLASNPAPPLPQQPSCSSIKSRFVISLNTQSLSSSSSEDEEAGVFPSVTLVSRRGKVVSSERSCPSSPFSQPLPLCPSSPVPKNKDFRLDTAMVRRIQTPSKPAPRLPKNDVRPFDPKFYLLKRHKSPIALSLQPYKKLVLKQSQHVEQLQAQLKRQEKVLSFRKRSEAILNSTLTSLKAKLTQTTKLYLNARKAVVRASKEKQLTIRCLNRAQKELEEMNSVVLRLSKRPLLPKPCSRSFLKPSRSEVEPLPSGIIELSNCFVNLLNKLEVAFRINSPLFHYFNLFTLSVNIPEEVEMTPATPDIRTSLLSTTSLDPNTPICPFYLNGTCVDSTCAFQHPVSLENLPVTPKTSLGSYVQSTPISEDPGSLCHVCGAQLDAEKGTVLDFCSTVRDWHTVFATCNDWTPYLDPPLDLARVHDTALFKHHLYAVLVSTDSPVAGAFDFLQKTNFHPLLFFYALNSTHLPSLSARRELVRKSLSFLLLLAHERASSLSASVSCMNALLCVVYHACRLEWEVCGSKIGLSLIEDLLLHELSVAPICLPPNHPARWALWYLRVVLLLSTTFPRPLNYCYLFESEKLVSMRDLFQVAALDLGLCSDCLPNFLSRCSQEGIPVSKISPVLAFSHLYVQFLAAMGDTERAGLFCLDAILSSDDLLSHDKLFFPTAIYLSNVCLQQREPAIFDLVSDLTNQRSIQTTFAYCFARLMQESGKSEPCSSLLSELVAGLIPLSSLDSSSVYSAFRSLLGLNKHKDFHMCDTKNTVFLWMCFGLFTMLHNLSSSLLPEFLNHVIIHLSDYQEEAFPCSPVALLLHLGLALANMLPTAEEYLTALCTLFFPPALTQDLNFCSNPPSWFFEIIQYIRVEKFSDSYPPTPLFARMLEVYGFRTLKALFASGGFSGCIKPMSLRWLQRVCSIARLEKPVDEEFWMLISALGVKFYPPERDAGRGLANYLVECLGDAVKLMPLNSKLWRLYAVVLRNCGFSEQHRLTLKNRVVAMNIGMEAVVKEVFETSDLNIFPEESQVVKSLACEDLANWWNQPS